MKALVMIFLFVSVIGAAYAAPTGHSLFQANFLQGVISAIESFFSSVFHVSSPVNIQTTACNLPNIPTGCTWVSTANQSAPCAGHVSCPVSTSTLKATTSTSISTSTSTSIPTTVSVSTTTTISPNATIQCNVNGFLRINESLSCTPVKLTLVGVGQGNTRYEIANVTVNIYFNNSLVFENESLLQNSTQYYQFNLSNGHIVQVYVTTAIYTFYPVNRYATFNVIYR